MAIIISVIMGKQERLDNLLEPNHAIHSFLKELQLSLFSSIMANIQGPNCRSARAKNLQNHLFCVETLVENQKPKHEQT